MKIHTSRKDHRCSECGRLIPAGTRYWRDFREDIDLKSHTNCEDFKGQPLFEDRPKRQGAPARDAEARA